jgi:hypothetical protein
MKSQTEPSADPERILIVLDGQMWWIRHIYLIEHKLDFNRKLYHSDRGLGGPFGSVEEAVAAAKEMLQGARRKVSTRSA